MFEPFRASPVEPSKKYDIKLVPPKALFNPINSFVKGEPPESPEAKFALEKFKLSWDTRAELENKKVSMATRIVLGRQVSSDDMAREDLKRVYEQAGTKKTKDDPAFERALLRAVDKLRPKEPQLIRDEYALAPTEAKVLEEFSKHKWERAANYLDSVDQKLKASPAFDALRSRISKVAQKNIKLIAENFAEKLSHGYKNENETYLQRYLNLGIDRRELFERSGALGIVSKRIASVLKGAPIRDEYTGIGEYEKMGFSRQELLRESDALGIAATRIAQELRTGYVDTIKRDLTEFVGIGLSRKDLLDRAGVFDLAVGHLKGDLAVFIEDQHTNLGEYVEMGLDRKALLQASGAADLAASKIAESLKIGRKAEVLDYIERYRVIGLSYKDLVAAVHRIDASLKVPRKSS